MRTKTLLAAAATLAVSLATSMAQVYSQNIVGYINMTVNPGFTLIANQLVASDGTNGLNAVFPTVPDGSLLYKFNAIGGNYSIDVYNADTNAAPIGWYDFTSGNPTTTTISPGEGMFFNSPRSTNCNITIVGSVKTGTNAVTLYPGFTLVSSVVPSSYELLNADFPVLDGMLYYAFSAGTYNISVYNGDTNAAPLGWYDFTSGNPVTVAPSVGQGFFINNPHATTNWTRAYNP